MAGARKYSQGSVGPVMAGVSAIVGGLYTVLGAVVMPLVFYLGVTPIALLLRAFGKDPLRRRFDPGADSYWIPRDPAADQRSSKTNQF